MIIFKTKIKNFDYSNYIIYKTIIYSLFEICFLKREKNWKNFEKNQKISKKFSKKEKKKNNILKKHKNKNMLYIT